VHTKLNKDYRVPKDLCPKNLMCDKPNNHNPVYQTLDAKEIRRRAGVNTKQADESLFNVRINDYVPRERFLMPQTTYQELGWCSSVMQQGGKATITGAVNYRPGKNPVYSPLPPGRTIT